MQAAIASGCLIVEVVEYGEQIGDEQWLEKMPAHLLIVGREGRECVRGRAYNSLRYRCEGIFS